MSSRKFKKHTFQPNFLYNNYFDLLTCLLKAFAEHYCINISLKAKIGVREDNFKC